MQQSTPSSAWDNPRLLEILNLISRRTCKFKGSSSESLAPHLSAYFNIRCFYIARCYLVFQRELMWHDSSLISAQTPACSAAWRAPYLGFGLLKAKSEPYVQTLLFTCLFKSSPCPFVPHTNAVIFWKCASKGQHVLKHQIKCTFLFFSIFI